MSVTTEVKILEADPNSLYKTQKIKFTSDKSILTPTKTIPLDKFRADITLKDNAKHLNEIFKRFSEKQIKEADEKEMAELYPEKQTLWERLGLKKRTD